MRRRVVVTSASARIALWMVFVVVGAIVEAFGLLMLIGSSGGENRYTAAVPAVVVGLEERTSTRYQRHGTRKHSQRETVTTYAPIYEYSYNGQDYRYTSKVSSNPPRFQAGQHVELKIDPDNPEKVYDNSGMANIACFIFMGAGAVFLFIGIFGVSLNAKRMKQNKTDHLPPSYSNWN
ncbi:MAG: DUF3592 domain-containing protein [Oscillospiraceae bacterium]|nr:DUF3592 domain-containing protein [Oscillospiraceae bacterium]